jgi:hypothetical protein
LLANIALHVIDEAWAKAASLGTLVRYADLCRHPHKSAYAEFRIMPRVVGKASIQAEIGLKSSA